MRNKSNVYIKTFDNKNYRYEVYNIDGKLIKRNILKKKGLNTVNLNSLSGIYVIKVISGKNVYRKIIPIIK